MSVVYQNETQRQIIQEGRTRYLAHTDNLMMVVIEFTDGPTSQPDAPHQHPHEQVTYVVEGEIVFHLGDEKHLLGPGDLITVAPNIPHAIRLVSARARLIDAFTPLRQDFLPQS